MARRRKGKASTSATQAPMIVERDPEVLAYMQEQMLQALLEKLQMVESDYDDPDDDEWTSSQANGMDYEQELHDVRQMVKLSSVALRALTLAEYYITTAGGPRVSVCLKEQPKLKAGAAEPDADPVVQEVCAAFKNWYEQNHWFTHGECIRRVWRDGRLCLWHKEQNDASPAKIRIVDPERIRSTDNSHENGIVTAQDDVLDIQRYIITRKVIDASGVEKLEEAASVPAEHFLDFKIGCDSTEKLGRSKFLNPLKTLRQLIRMVDNEVQLRIAQSSITMVTEVAGGTSAVRAMLSAHRTADSTAIDNIGQREKSRSGVHKVVGKGSKVTYSHPDNNFSDAGPLINLLKKDFGSATGWSFSMLSSDTSEGNLASEQLSTGPVSEMIKTERFEYARQMTPFFKWILADAGVDVDWEKYTLDVDFPELTAMDPLKASQIVTGAIMNETMSRATGRLRLNLDPDYEERQIAKEKQSGLYNAGFNNQMGGADNQATSSQANATQGAGGNQGQSSVTGQNTP